MPLRGIIAMNTAKSILISSLILVSSTSLAQNEFRMEFLGGASVNNLTEGVFSLWGTGWNIGTGGAYRAANGVELAANVIYQRYPFRGGTLELVTPAVQGFRRRVSGQASDVIEGSIAARFSASNSLINPILSLRTGLYFMNVGNVLVSEWLDVDPQNVSQSTYHGTGVSRTKLFGAVGFGVSILTNSTIRVIVDGQFTETLDGEETFLPIQITIQIDL
jgi:hypothetical protein